MTRIEKSSDTVYIGSESYIVAIQPAEFQTRGPAVAKHRSPYALCARRTTHDSESDDRRRRGEKVIVCYAFCYGSLHEHE